MIFMKKSNKIVAVLLALVMIISAVPMMTASAAHTHEYVLQEGATEATCTEDGEMSRTCADCGAVETQVIPAGHNWNDGVETKRATCTEEGVLLRNCVYEGCTAKKTEAISAIGHKQEVINTVIYGAGDAGMITLNALEQDTSANYNVVAFIDNSSKKIGKSIMAFLS
jgi:hypothetical protein